MKSAPKNLEAVLRTLSDLQIESEKRGIDFRVDLTHNDKNVSIASINVSYTTTGSIQKGYVFTTSISTSHCESKQKDRLNEIKQFIDSIRL